MATGTGYYNGSDLLLKIGGKAIGHCTSHTVTYNSETKERAVKPVATLGKAVSLWTEKGVVKLTISITGEGLTFYGETENGYDALAALWGKGESVEVIGFERENDANPWLTGNFVISSIEQTAPAMDDVTYSISLENDGAPSICPGMTTSSTSEE